MKVISLFDHRRRSRRDPQILADMASIQRHVAQKGAIAVIHDRHRAEGQILTVPKDFSNGKQRGRIQRRLGAPAVEELFEALKERKFDFAEEHDSNGRLTYLFLVDPRSAQVFAKSLDVRMFDATFRTNSYSMPLINIIGCTGMSLTICLGIALMMTCKEADFMRLLNDIKSALDKHEIPQPRIINTDRDLAGLNAIDKVFPHATHI